MDIENARILVTGGSAGIGAAIARAARDRGARVAINGRDPQRLRATATELGLPSVAGDVGRDAADIVAGTVELLGGLDVLVNNAGWGRMMPLEELDAEVFEQMWRTNVLGAALMARARRPALRGGRPRQHRQHRLDRGAARLRRRNGLRLDQVRPGRHEPVLAGRAAQARRPGDPDQPQRGADRLRRPRRGRRDRARRSCVSEDIAQAVIAALEMHDRGFIPELTVFATNPW